MELGLYIIIPMLAMVIYLLTEIIDKLSTLNKYNRAYTDVAAALKDLIQKKLNT